MKDFDWMSGDGKRRRGKERLTEWEIRQQPPKKRSLQPFPLKELRLLHTLTDDAHSLAISPDGLMLVSAGIYGAINIRSLLTGTHLRAITSHTGEIWSLAISPDGQTLLSAESNRLVKPLPNQAPRPRVNLIKTWNLAQGTEVCTLTGHTSPVSRLAISPDSQFLVSGDLKGMIRIWNLTQGTQVHTLSGHTGIIYSLAISPDGQFLVSGGSDDAIRIWNLAQGTQLHTFSGHEGGIWSLAISPDGQILVSSGNDDHTIKIWGRRTPRRKGGVGMPPSRSASCS